MEESAVVSNDEIQSHENKIEITIQPNSNNNFIVNHKGLNFYAIDIKKVGINNIKSIISECEEIEKKCWNAQECFQQYMNKCDVLVYVMKNKKIIAFNLLTLMFYKKYCIFSLDESMVLKEFTGRNIAQNMAMITARWIFKNFEQIKNVKKYVPLSISANPKVINFYYKNKYVKIFFDSSFSPSEKLIELHKVFLNNNNMTLVHDNYPFWIKNLFPGSHQFNKDDKKYQLIEDIEKLLPPDFNYYHRGDAFAYMAIVHRIPIQIVLSLFMFIGFGWKAWFDKKIGLFRKTKNL